MSFKATWFRDKLNKKAKRGFQGYPVATITYYGPDDRQASKVSVGIVLDERGDVAFLERWFNLGLIFVKTQIGANAQPAWLCATERHSACVYKFWLF